MKMRMIRASKNFYPRSPCGERHQRLKAQMSKFLFLSTLSLRRATEPAPTGNDKHNIFLSTLSLRRATILTITIYTVWKFLSTLSLRRATRGKVTGGYDRSDFYPRSPCGERPVTTLEGAESTKDFYPRSPCGERPASQTNLPGRN